MTNSLSALSLDVCVFLIRMGFVTTIILSLTWLIVTMLRKQSAAIRHGLWFAAVVGCCVAPAFVALLPVPTFLVVQPVDNSLLSNRNQAEEQTNLPAPIKEVDSKVFTDHTPVNQFSSADELGHPQFDFDSHAEQPRMNDARSTEIDKSALSAGSPIAIETASKPGWHQMIARMSAWLTGLWLAVAVGLLFRIAFAVEATRRLCQQSEPCDDRMTIELLTNFRQELRIKRTILLKLSEEIQVPMIAGLVRPSLLLPAESSLWSPERLQAVIRHELGHVARADLASQFVADLAIAVWWFQPLLWHAARRMRIEREFACDDLVLESGTSPCDYADELLAIASQAGSDQISSPIVVAMAGRTTVEQRIRAILDPALNRIPWSRRGAAALTIMLLIALSVIAPLTPTISARQPAKPSLDEKSDVAIAAEESTSNEGATSALLASDEQTEATPLLESPLENTDVATRARTSKEPPNEIARVKTDRDARDVDRVRVVCLDSGEEPVAGAEVYLYQFDGKTKAYQSFGPYISDQSGQVTCEQANYYTQEQAEDLTKTGNYDRWIYARVAGKLIGVARCVRWKGRGEFNAGGRVVLYSSHSIEGKVAVPEGFDVTKVKVMVRTLHVSTGPDVFDHQSFPREFGFPGLDTALPQVFEKFPNADGSVRFDDVPILGSLYLVTHAEGLGEAQWRNNTPRFDQPIQLILAQESRLAGKVLTPDRQPLAGTTIIARLHPTRPESLMFLSSFYATSDENGEFEIRGLPQTDYILTVRDPQKRWSFRPLLLGMSLPNTEVRRTCVMENTIRVSGLVVDETGQPVATANLSAMSDDQHEVSLDHAGTDDHGNFELQLPAGKIRLYFNALPPGFIYPEPQIFKELEIQPKQGEINDLKIVLKRKESPKADSNNKPNEGEAKKSKQNEDEKASLPIKKKAEKKLASAVGQEKSQPAPKRSLIQIGGQVVDENGQGVSGAEVILETYEIESPRTITDEKGQFTLSAEFAARKRHTLAAQADHGQRMGLMQISGDTTEEQRKQLQIKLVATRKAMVHVVNQQGDPIAGATAGILAGNRDAGAATTDAEGNATIVLPHDSDIQYAYAVKPKMGLDYRSYVLSRENRNDRNAIRPKFPDEGLTLTLDGIQPLEVALTTKNNQPIPGTGIYIWLLKKPGESDDLNLSYLTRRKLLVGTTDIAGRVEFDWIPQWQKSTLTLWPQTKEFVRERGSYDPQTGAGRAVMHLERLVRMSGSVLLPNGDPAAGISIDIAGAGYTVDEFRQLVKTGTDGKYEVLAAPNQVYLLIVKDQKWAAQPITGFALWPEQPIDNLNFQLKTATRVHGRVTIGPEHKPVVGMRITSYQNGQEAHSIKGVALPNPEKANHWVSPTLFHHAVTDMDGNYEFFVGPGKFDIRGPNQSKVEKFEIAAETERTFDFHMPRPEKGILKGLVVDANTHQPVEGAQIEGIERWHFSNNLNAVTDANGRFELERNLHLTAFRVSSPDRSLAVILEVDADTNEITIPLRPTASASGVLMDEELNSPVAEKEFSYGMNIYMGDNKAPFLTTWGGKFKTDEKGRFQLRHLAIGGIYRINQPLGDGTSSRQVATFTTEKPGESELGTITIKKHEEYRAPTTAERIQSAFKSDNTPTERFDAILPDAKLSRLRVLVLFANPESNATSQFMALRYEDTDVGSAFDDFRLIAVNSSAGYFDEAKLLAEKFDRDLHEGRSVFFAVVTDAEGKLIDAAEAGVLMRGGVINQEKVLAFLAKNKLPPLVAKDLFDDAMAKAKKENKRIILQETATWCGPCWRLSRFLDKHREEWETDYLWVKMDHRWTGAQELMKSIRGEAQGGIPWIAVINADGKVLVTSNTPTGENIGFPSEPDEINHFQAMLKRTIQRMTPDQVDKLVDELRPKN